MGNDGATSSSSVTSVSTSASLQADWATASSELSEDLNSVSVADLFNMPPADLRPQSTSSSTGINRLDVDDQVSYSLSDVVHTYDRYNECHMIDCINLRGMSYALEHTG